MEVYIKPKIEIVSGDDVDPAGALEAQLHFPVVLTDKSWRGNS